MGDAITTLGQESRNLTDVSTTESWNAYFGISSTVPEVTQEGALRLSAVLACVRVLSEALASLPFGVHEDYEGRKSTASNHPNHYLVKVRPNEQMTAFVFKELIMTYLLLWGNFFAEIIRGGNGRPISYRVFKPWQVSVTEYNGLLYYSVAGRKEQIRAENMIHVPGLGFDGLVGKSLIRMQAESLGINLSAQKFGSKFFQNGAHLGGILVHPGKLGPDGVKTLQTSWRGNHAGVDNVGHTAILQEGMKYERIGIPPEEAQFIQTRQFGNTEIAGWFKVPPHMIGDLSHGTFSNIEFQDTSFAKHSLVPWAVRIEQEFDRKTFRRQEEGRFYYKFNMNALMRGDSVARANYYQIMQKNANLSSNEVRELEDMNPYEGGDRYYVQANNMVPVDKIDEFIAGKSNTTTTNTQENTDPNRADDTIQESDGE